MTGTDKQLYVLGLALLVSGMAQASERPNNPYGMEARTVDSTSVALTWLSNTYIEISESNFEVEVTRFDQRLPQAEEARLSERLPARTSLPGMSNVLNFTVQGLVPESKYCFRMWERIRSSGMRSDAPSDWSCAITPAYAPLAPLDVKARLLTSTDPRPRVSWNAAAQANHHTVRYFVIEKQSPVGENYPWQFEQRLAAGPLNYSVIAAQVNPRAQTAFRVCAENLGSRTCGEPTRLELDSAALRATSADMGAVDTGPGQGQRAQAPAGSNFVAPSTQTGGGKAHHSGALPWGQAAANPATPIPRAAVGASPVSNTPSVSPAVVVSQPAAVPAPPASSIPASAIPSAIATQPAMTPNPAAQNGIIIVGGTPPAPVTPLKKSVVTIPH